MPDSEPKAVGSSAPRKSDVPITTPKAAMRPLLTPEQAPEGKAALQTPTDTTTDTIPARWRRNRGPMNAKQKQEAEQQAFLAEMKAHFAEANAVELAVETPTPPGKILARQRGTAWIPVASDKPRAMSLGLSRRSTLGPPRVSVLSSAMATPSPLRFSFGPRSSFVPLPDAPDFNFDGEEVPTRRLTTHSTVVPMPDPRRSSVMAPVTADGRRSSVMPPSARRSSAAAHMFGRLSLRISDALGRLSRPSHLPELPEVSEQGTAEKAEEKEREEEEEERNGLAVEKKPPHDEGELDSFFSCIFTIAEEAESPTVPTPVVEAEAPDDHATAEASEEDSVVILGEALQAGLDLGPAGEEAEETASPTFSELAPLEQLLRLCGQEIDVAGLPCMDDLLGRHVDLTKVKKIGEGTFGEAFKAGNLVLKIVPMEGSILVNGEPQKRSEEILAEVAITLTLSGLRQSTSGGLENENNNSGAPCALKSNATAGFVETHGVGICRGRYAAALSKEWHRWDKQNGSENDPVDIFEDEQLFVVFVVADGGLDLEHFEPRSFAELQSILMQVTMTLAVAEEACEFEHRDLHWGNLLISRDGTESVPYRLRDVDISVETAGVRVTLIDFTLSRLVTPEGEIAFCDLAADPELFNGPKGDVQAETYRRMQKATKGDWQRFTPMTNTLWLRYLADIILAHKLPNGCSGDDRLLLRNFRKAATGAEKAGDLVWHEMFAGKWTSETK